jgi:hypothetical protein
MAMERVNRSRGFSSLAVQLLEETSSVPNNGSATTTTIYHESRRALIRRRRRRRCQEVLNSDVGVANGENGANAVDEHIQSIDDRGDEAVPVPLLLDMRRNKRDMLL